jgi:pimeloyl-ACP methyl ester carboxylesterase
MHSTDGLFIHESGRASGRPIVFFHGFPGSHRQSAFLERFVDSFHLRILSVDRPGYGYSAPLSKGLAGLVLLLEQELNRRGVEEFFLLGVSGGNPAALCSAGHFGERVLAVGSVCGMAPFPELQDAFSCFQRRGFKVVRWAPEPFLRHAVGRVLDSRNPQERVRNLLRRVSDRDREVLQRPEVYAILMESIELATRQGSAGIVFDLKTLSRAWPLKWPDIRMPFYLWHGERDLILSPDMSRYMHSRVPHAKLRMMPNGGHYSLPVDQTELILSDLLSQA